MGSDLEGNPPLQGKDAEQVNNLRWSVYRANPKLAAELAREAHVSHLVGQMLANRKIFNAVQAGVYLQPSLGDLHDPELIAGCEEAALRIAKAISTGEKIAIFGDYDVDGVTGTTIMYHALKHWGADLRLYIPHRLNEGYGMSPEAVKRLVAEGCKLIVSVDCGITAVEPAKAAAEAGVDLIITDHHDWKDVLPECYVKVHPRLKRKDGGVYPNPMICGAGVAFKVAWQVGRAVTGEQRVPADYSALLMELVAFAALGTIADVVPLTGENRVIAVHGLRKLPDSRFDGVRALLASAGLGEKDVDGYHVGFCLAPRLNAAGRMGHASTALDMFTVATPERAAEIAKDLETQNKERQATERAIVVEAKAQAAQYEGMNAIVVVGKDWHSGVVGIVASRIIDEYYRPAIVLVETDDVAHGSARSIEGFNLAAGLKECEDLFERWGGHAAAAGIKMPLKNVEEFRRRLHEYVTANCPVDLLRRRLTIDAWCELSDITVDLAKQMKAMGPYGIGNHRPVLALSNVLIQDPKTMGKDGKHLRFMVEQGGHRLKCIAWNQGEQAHKLPTDQWVEIAVEPQINEWQGRESVELLCRDVRLPE
jgi:single-stranded-DNA-specific exonuclease